MLLRQAWLEFWQKSKGRPLECWADPIGDADKRWFRAEAGHSAFMPEVVMVSQSLGATIERWQHSVWFFKETLLQH